MENAVRKLILNFRSMDNNMAVTACPPIGLSAEQWLRAAISFEFCSFYVLMVIVELIFVALLLVQIPIRLVASYTLQRKKLNIQGLGLWHSTAEWVCWLDCTFYGILILDTVWRWWRNHRQEVSIQYFIFLSVQCFAWLAISAAVRTEAYRGYGIHTKLLKSWWTSILIVSVYGVCVIIGSRHLDIHHTLLDSVIIGFSLVSSLFLVSVCFTSMYKVGRSVGEDLTAPLLDSAPKKQEDFTLELKWNKKHILSEYYDAGILKRGIFSWMNPLFRLGNRKPLELTDIRDLGYEDEANLNSSAFLTAWKEQMERVGPERLSIMRTLGKVYWKPFMFSIILVVVQTCVMFAGPIMLNQIVAFMASENRSASRGVTLVSVLFIAKTVEGLSEHQFAFHAQKLGLRMWLGVGGAVYGKVLRLSQKVRLTRSVGDITNMLSSDLQRLIYLTWYLQQGFVLPIQVGIAMVVLYKVVGVAMLTGLTTLVGVLVLNIFVVGAMRRFRINVLELKDKRMRVTTEALSNMKVLKLQSWEDRFRKKIEDLRDIERSWLARFMFTWAISIFMVWFGPLAASAVTFLTVVLRGGPLNTARVFTAITTFRILQDPVRFIPDILSNVIQATVSLERIKKFLLEEEIDEHAVQKVHDESPAAVAMENAAFTWDSSTNVPSVRNLNLKIRKGSCVAICGGVGSGKSTLLSCILGELPRVSGTATLCGSVAYVAQSAWIQNKTVRENILFGHALNFEKYNEALRVSGLLADLSQFPHGDETEIGERGINMSGGQKQRIQLARAVYQDADVYLLDDPFSAVDAHTGAFLFEEYVRGALASKTVILVTHQVEFLPGTDLIIVMKDGEIIQSGSYHNLVSEGRDFGVFVDALENSLKSVNQQVKSSGEANPILFSDKHLMVSKTVRDDSLNRGQVPNEEAALTKSCSAKENFECLMRNSSTRSSTDVTDVSMQKGRIILDEERATGRVSCKVTLAYLTKVYKGALTIIVVFIQITTYGLQLSSDSWLAGGTSEEGKTESIQFIGIYALLTAGCACAVLMRTSLVAFLGLATAQAFFLRMIRNIFRAPMSFFDSTPLGRILSRSSTDQTSLDLELPNTCSSCINNVVGIIGTVLVTSYATPHLLIIIVPLGLIYAWLQVYSVTLTRELSRLTAMTEAPLFLHVGETYAGASTIRAFQKQGRFEEINAERFKAYHRSMFHFLASSSWLGVRLESLGALVVSAAAFFLVIIPRASFNPGLAGLSLSYGLALNGILMRLVYFFSSIENKLVSVERISQYSDVPNEAPAVIHNRRPGLEWPNEGKIELRNLQVQYRPGAPHVLKGISCTIQPREKVGVVGRTGSGKSTLIQALFRLIEPSGGQIIIDGIDVCTIGLSDLRSRLSVIPQEPTLFEGTVRTNMDPLDMYPDHLVWEALEKCQLAHIVKEKPEKLHSTVSEQGENWSVGERQLLCLGRALLRQASILVLDEATASVDIFTDAVIQNTIRHHFVHCTVISVAHRIPTVIDSDRVLVLDGGKLKENGAPEHLLSNENSLFSKLVQEYTSHAGSGSD